MIVDPDFFDHWRTQMVADLLGGDQLAPLYIMRLWAHCQNRRSDTFDIPSAGLKALCKFHGDAEALEAALIAAEYISRDGASVTVVGWAEKNSSLLAAWENGSRGGRPKKTHGLPTGIPAVTHGQPMGNPPLTQTKPIREEKRREEKKEETKTARKRAAPAALVSVDNLVEAGVERQHASDWLAVRKAKNLPLTATAWADMQAEAAKAGLSLNEAIKRVAIQGWAGFRASWLQQAEVPRNQGPPPTVPSTDNRADEFRAAMEQRAAESTKPPAEVLALVRKVRTV